MDAKNKKDLKAAALKYEKGTEDVPRIVAKGKGELAQRIIELAEEHGLHIHKDADLVEVLEKVELNDAIPLEVYAVVAEIFAYLYRLNKEKS